MPDWEERISRETSPALRAEHDLRYALAAPLIAEAGTWCDLGCGNGIAAADVLAGRFDGRAVLVDVDADAARSAERELGIADTTTLTGDLSDPADVDRVREAVLAGPAPRVVTCFEVVEHLRSFVALVDALSALAEAGEVTALLSVPNDAFWALENPYHETMWGEGAFAELRSMLPASAVVARQVPLAGSIVVPESGGGEETSATLQAPSPAAIPSHFLIAMGPSATQLGVHAAVAATDLDAHRRWERQRDADNAYFQAAVKRLQHENDEFRTELRRHYKDFADMRRYVHELEGRLGIPISGDPVPDDA